MDLLGGFVLKNEKIIVFGSIIFVLIGVLGMPKIERKVNMIDYFKPNSSTRIADEIMRKKFGGSIPIQILVQGDMQNPYVLKEIRLFEKYLKSLKNVHNPQAMADLISEMNDVMFDEKTIPDSKDKIINLWFLLEGQDILSRLVNDEKTEGVIQATVNTIETERLNDIAEKVDNYIYQIDKDLVVVNLNQLPEQAKAEACRYRAKKVASAILWDAQGIAPEINVSKDSVEQRVISRAYPLQLSPALLLEDIVDNFPEPLKNNREFIEKVRNDLVELYEENAAIPEK